MWYDWHAKWNQEWVLNGSRNVFKIDARMNSKWYHSGIHWELISRSICCHCGIHFDGILRDTFWCHSGIIRCLMGIRSDVLSGYYWNSFWIHFVIIPGSIWYQNWHGNIGRNHFKFQSGINENDCIMDYKRNREWYQNEPGKVLKVIRK